MVPGRTRFATRDTWLHPPATIGHLRIPPEVHFRRFPNGTFATWQLPDNFTAETNKKAQIRRMHPQKRMEFTELTVFALLRVRMYRSNKVCHNICSICGPTDSRRLGARPTYALYWASVAVKLQAVVTGSWAVGAISNSEANPAQSPSNLLVSHCFASSRCKCVTVFHLRD